MPITIRPAPPTITFVHKYADRELQSHYKVRVQRAAEPAFQIHLAFDRQWNGVSVIAGRRVLNHETKDTQEQVVFKAVLGVLKSGELTAAAKEKRTIWIRKGVHQGEYGDFDESGMEVFHLTLAAAGVDPRHVYNAQSPKRGTIYTSPVVSSRRGRNLYLSPEKLVSKAAHDKAVKNLVSVGWARRMTENSGQEKT